jgi:hypothetical protein
LLLKFAEKVKAESSFEVLGCLIVIFKLKYPGKLAEVAEHLRKMTQAENKIIWSLDNGLETLNDIRSNLKFAENAIYTAE